MNKDQDGHQKTFIKKKKKRISVQLVISLP